ncbi:MAG: Wzz/FepE/Etk N-terminal domain-containing protein [Victivallaceae bacterium]
MNDKDTIQSQSGNEVSLMLFFGVILKYRWLVIMLTAIGIIAGAVFTRQTYKENYLVAATIFLQSPRKVTDSKDYLGSIQTKDLLNNTFNSVLSSNDFFESIVLKDYDILNDGKKIKGNLLKYFKTEDVGKVIDVVKKLVKIRYDKKTNILVLEYTSTYPDVAAQILNNTVSQINFFYNHQFNSNSIRNLEFVEKSIASSRKELDEAKNKLAVFIERNKQLKVALKNKEQYPEYYQCIEELEKLQENAELKRKNYASLLIKSESLKLEISENAPYITVIESATVPLKPIPCKYTRNVALGGVLGFILAAVYIILTNFILLFNLQATPVANIPAEFKNDFKKLLRIFSFKKNNKN